VPQTCSPSRAPGFSRGSRGGRRPRRARLAAALTWLAGWGATWLELVARLVVASRRSGGSPNHGHRGALRRRRLARRSPAHHSACGRGGSACCGGVTAPHRRLVSVRPAPARTSPPGSGDVSRRGAGDAVLLETPSAGCSSAGGPEANVAGQLRRAGVGSLSALVLRPQRDYVGGAGSRPEDTGQGDLDPALEATGPDREEAVPRQGRRVPV
jgi:hypothetical protein